MAWLDWLLCECQSIRSQVALQLYTAASQAIFTLKYFRYAQQILEFPVLQKYIGVTLPRKPQLC